MANAISKRGTLGWALTAATVAVWDFAADDTMSAAFERGLARPRGRFLVATAWVVLTAHLFGWLPDRYDPFAGLLKAVKA